eukprot:Lithocolla_globosa_v1_NODE_10365_length_606_cov_3.617060.p1 type:complete len:151 gc:universal NODE_10365_length_606_cov_3.617060:508-56(-)
MIHLLLEFIFSKQDFMPAQVVFEAIRLLLYFLCFARIGVNAASDDVVLSGLGSSSINALFHHYSQLYSTMRSSDRKVSLVYEHATFEAGLATLDRGDVDYLVVEHLHQGDTSDFVQLPFVVEAVVITYNLPGEEIQLKLSLHALARIFST